MPNWTDQTPQIATEEDCKASWNCVKNGKRFRCYLCGVRFKVGDYWRFVYAGDIHLLNFMVCANCDCENIKEVWQQRNQELKDILKKCWWRNSNEMD